MVQLQRSGCWFDTGPKQSADDAMNNEASLSRSSIGDKQAGIHMNPAANTEGISLESMLDSIARQRVRVDETDFVQDVLTDCKSDAAMQEDYNKDS
jgi:hypothetical protein